MSDPRGTTARFGSVPARGPQTGARRAHLRLVRLDPWTVLRITAVVGLCLLVVFVVAVAVLYAVLAGLGVFAAVEHTVHTALNLRLPLSPVGIIGGAAFLGLLNVVLFTAMATVGAFIYNVAADLVGGAEGVLAERE